MRLSTSYFLNGIVYARLPTLLSRDSFETLILTKDVEDFLSRLTSNPFYYDLKVSDPKDPLLFEKRLMTILMNEFGELSKYDRKMREVMEYYLLPYRARNLGLLTSSKPMGLTWGEVSRLIIPDPFTGIDFYETLYSLSLESILAYLEGKVLRGALEALKVFESTRDPTVLEAIIMKLSYEERINYFAKLRGGGAEAFLDCLLLEADVINILTIYKGKVMGISNDVIALNVIKAGYLYPTVILKVLEYRSPREVMDYFLSTEYGFLFEGISEAFEVALRARNRLNKLLYLKIGTILLDPSSPLLPLAYLKLREIEVESVRRIYHFKRLGLKGEKLREVIPL
ncbi:MAG: hypothetical protein B6U69_03730 [Thermofilum sp. ex4484_15]|nr:MAG: hypothetical protein B6U69_03730 [Thermofilum sp. ex4484_15]